MDTNQFIFDALRSMGLSVMGALGFMGNMAAESNMIPYRVQGDFSANYADSQKYTDRVDNGTIEKNTFINDAKGYGLCQWTYYTRKSALYDYAKEQGMSIGALLLQLSFIGKELDSSEYSGVKTALKSASDLYTATSIVCKQYEKPADQSESAISIRAAKAMQIANNINIDAAASTNTTVTLDTSSASGDSEAESYSFGEAVESALEQAATAVSGRYTLTATIAVENGNCNIESMRMEKL